MAGFGAQFEQAIDDRIDARLTVFKDALQKQYNDELGKVKTEFQATKKDLQKMKTSYNGLNATVDAYSSKVTNNENSFATAQAAIKHLDEVVNGDGRTSLATVVKEVSKVRRACRAHDASIKSMASAHYDMKQQLSTQQAGLDKSQQLMNAVSNAFKDAHEVTPHSPTAPPSSQYGVFGPCNIAPATSRHPTAIATEPLTARPSSARADAHQIVTQAQQAEHAGQTVAGTTSAPDPEYMQMLQHRPQSAATGDQTQFREQSTGNHLHTMMSSHTYRETSTVTARSHQPTSPAPDAMEEEEEDEIEDEVMADQEQMHSSSEIIVSHKRRANQAHASHSESQSTPIALIRPKRRRAESNLKRASSDPVQQTPATSMALDAQLPMSASSGIDLPSWLDSMTESATPGPNNVNPLQGWGARTQAETRQAREQLPSQQPAEPASIVRPQAQTQVQPQAQPTDYGLSAVPAPASSQRRSGRARQPTEPYPGQILFPRNVPDYGRQAGGSMV